MKKLYFLLVLIAIAASAAAAQKITNVRQINFKNFTYKVSGKSVVLKAGLQPNACGKKNADGIPEGDIWSLVSNKPSFGDLDGDGADEAIVTLVANVCGGTMITDEAIVVLSAKNGRAKQLPNFDYFDEGCEAGTPGCNYARQPGAGARFDAATKTIVVETFFSTDDDAVCCPSLYRETWYKWNGTAFAETKKGKVTKKPE